MKHRSPAAVFFLPFITFGIYGLVWSVKTKNEMNNQGAEIPTAWLLIVPFVSLYWLWKYSEGVEKVTGGKTSAVLAFVLQILLGMIGMAILQSEFNKLGDAPLAAGPQADGSFQPQTSVEPVQPTAPLPDNSFGGPVTSAPEPIAPQQPVAPVAPSAPVAPVEATPQPVSAPVAIQVSDASTAAGTVVSPSEPVAPTQETPQA